jgi:hypothetical protein
MPKVQMSSLVKEMLHGDQNPKWAFKFRKNPSKKHTGKKLQGTLEQSY